MTDHLFKVGWIRTNVPRPQGTNGTTDSSSSQVASLGHHQGDRALAFSSLLPGCNGVSVFSVCGLAQQSLSVQDGGSGGCPTAWECPRSPYPSWASDIGASGDGKEGTMPAATVRSSASSRPPSPSSMGSSSSSSSSSGGSSESPKSKLCGSSRQ